MTPGLLRPLTKSFDHRGNNGSNNRSPAEVQTHFSWLHRRQHYSPAAQQQQQQLQQQQQQQQQLQLQQQQQQQQQRGVDSFSRAATTEKRKALTLGSWGSNRLSGKSLLFEKLAKLKKKNGAADLNNNNNSSGGNNNGINRPKPLFRGPQVSTSHCDDGHDDPLIVVCDFCTTNDADVDDVGKEPEWLNIEKSVRFRLPETKMSEASKSKKSAADDEDDDDVDDDDREADFWGYYEPAPELERPNFGGRRERMFSCNEFHPSQQQQHQGHQQPHQHHSVRGGSFCPEHPVRRNLSYGEGLNEFQYLPGVKEAPCCPCCCSLPVMVMPPPPPGCSRCCPVMTPTARHFDDRFSHLYPNRQVSMALASAAHQFLLKSPITFFMK